MYFTKITSILLISLIFIEITHASSPDQPESIDTLIQLAQTHQQLGYYQQAYTELTDALTYAQYQDDTLHQALILSYFSELHRIQGEQIIARNQITQALELANTLKKQPSILLAQLFNQQGNILMVDKNYPKAEKSYATALNFAKQAKDTLFITKILINQAQIFLETQQSLETIQTTLQLASQTIKSFTTNDEKIRLLLHITELQQKLIPKLPQLLDNTYQRLQEIIKIASNSPRFYSKANAQLAQLYQQQQQYSEATQLIRRAIFAAQQIQAIDLLYHYQKQLGQLWLLQGEKISAIAAYQQAVTYLDSIRNQIMRIHRYGEPTHFRETEAGQIYFELIDLLLQQATDNTTEQQIYLERARQTIELFRQAELENYFQDDCAQKRYIIDTSTQLANVAVLYPIIFYNRLTLLVYFPKKSTLFQANIPVTDLESKIGEFLSELTVKQPNTIDDILPSAQALYQLLIQPISQQIAQTQLLVIIPDERLRTIPFAALHDGRQFLIEKYALATTPSLNLTNLSQRQWDNIHIFASGLSKSVQGFQSLPYTEIELKSIKAEYQTDELINEHFTKQAFGEKLMQTPYTIVHIASHGNFSNNYKESFLLTYDNRIYLNELKKLIHFNQFRDNSIELLTLSACESAQGNDKAALGLAGVAIKAGTKSAIASLWQVNDQATCQLMTTFYHFLQNKHFSKAKALQQAQIQLLKKQSFQNCDASETADYRHPAYWAAFLLIGNWL